MLLEPTEQPSLIVLGSAKALLSGRLASEDLVLVLQQEGPLGGALALPRRLVCLLPLNGPDQGIDPATLGLRVQGTRVPTQTGDDETEADGQRVQEAPVEELDGATYRFTGTHKRIPPPEKVTPAMIAATTTAPTVR